jgi:hypothetical protein
LTIFSRSQPLGCYRNSHICGTQRFTAVSTKACQLSPSSAISILSTLTPNPPLVLKDFEVSKPKLCKHLLLSTLSTRPTHLTLLDYFKLIIFVEKK